jgi:hypothetical protein
MSESTKTIEVSTGPFKNLRFIGHMNAAEYDAEAQVTDGAENSAVDVADVSDMYRSGFPSFHKAIGAMVEELSGIKRGINEKATAAAKLKAKDPEKVEDVGEAYPTYFNRVEAALSGTDEGKAIWKEIDQKSRAVAAATKCDSSPSRREKGLPKDVLAKADEIIARPVDARDAAIAKILAGVDGVTVDTDEAGVPDRESLGRAIQAYYKASL